MTTGFEAPRWRRDLERFLPFKSQFVLSGNVRDLQAVEMAQGVVTTQTLVATLASTLKNAGFAETLLFAPLTGFSRPSIPGNSATELPPDVAALLEMGAGAESLSSGLERLAELKGEPVALVIDFAARLLVRPADLSAQEHQLFTRALMLSHQVRARPVGEARRPFFNTVVWIVDKEGDLPDEPAP